MTTSQLNSEEYQAPEGWVNPISLYICRTRMNLSPEQVEQYTGIREVQINEWEHSTGMPSLQDLEVLSKLYRCPLGYFFIEKPPAQYTGSIDFRGLSRDKYEHLSYESRLKIDEFVTLADALSDIVKESKIKINTQIAVSHIGDNMNNLVSEERERFGFSHKIRDKWVHPDEAFYFWKKGMEDKGVYVISLGLNVNEIRGASKWDDDSPPVILVNKNDYESATGRTFTLLHEWAHLMLRQPGIICDFIGDKEKIVVEHFANKFAAEMMVSDDELKELLKVLNLDTYRARWSDEDINRVKTQFKVSKDVIAISLERLGLAPDGFYKTKRGQWDKRIPFYRNQGRRKTFNKTKVMRRFEELGKPFSSTIADAYSNGTISLSKLSNILDIKVEKLSDFVNYTKVAEY